MASGFRRFTRGFLLLLHIITAIAFLVSCYVSWFNPVKLWYLGLLNVGSFYLLAALILFFILWILFRKRYAWITVICFILAWKPLQQLFPFRLPQTFHLAKDSAVLRVMSWNVAHFNILEHKKHPEKKQEMIDVINEFQPDVACFQEMVGSDSAKPAINYIPDFEKAMNMPWNYYSYERSIDFDDKHHFGIITFSRYPIINQKTISYPPYNYNSIFQYIDIVKGTDTIRIFNIHLQSLKFSSKNLRYIDDPSLKDSKDLEKSKSILYKFRTGFLKRKTQSDHVREEMDKSPYPVIVCGDFNDLPNSYAYAHIGKGMKNAFAEKGSGPGRTFSGISPTLRIDNIFADPIFKIDQYTRVGRKLSDHFPILADISKEKP